MNRFFFCSSCQDLFFISLSDHSAVQPGPERESEREGDTKVACVESGSEASLPLWDLARAAFTHTSLFTIQW